MDSISPDVEQFGYSWKDRLQDYRVLVVILFSGLSLYVFLRELIGLSVMLFSSSTSTSSSANLTTGEIVVGLVLLPFIFYGMPHSILNLFPAVRTSQSGIEVQVFENFHYTWKSVPWQAIRALYPVVKFGWLYDHTGRCIYLLEVDKLSTWHRQMSITYGNGNHHALVFNQDFPEVDAMLDKIRQHLP